MVVIFACATADTGTEQERTASPSTCTVHAPHCATPQPYFVPVRPTCSRITQSRGVVGSTSTSWDLPLMVRRILVSPLLDTGCERCRRGWYSGRKYEPKRRVCHYRQSIMRRSKSVPDGLAPNVLVQQTERHRHGDAEALRVVDSRLADERQCLAGLDELRDGLQT